MTDIRFEPSWYPDDINFSISYTFGDCPNELGLFLTGELYWCYNGLMKMVVI